MADLTVIGLAIETKQAEAAANRMLKLLNQLEKQADSTVLAFNKFGGGLSGVSGKLMGVSGASTRLAGGLNLVRGAFLVASGAVVTFVGALTLLAKRGIEINATLESSTLGIASLIASLNTLKQGDVELKGIEALNAAIPLAEEQMKKLRIAGLETAATIETLVDAFQQAIGAGAAAGLSLEQIRNFTIDIVQAASALKVPYQQISQEVRTILEGTIDQNARIAKALGITNAMVRNWREQGTLAEELNRRLEVFRASGERIAKTFAGVTSNAREAFDVFAGTATNRAFATITQRLQGVIENVIDTKALDINNRLKPVADFFDDLATGAATRLFDVIDGGIDLLKEMGDFLKDNRDLVDELSFSTDLLLDRVASLGDTVTMVFSGKGRQSVSLFNKYLQGVALEIAFVQDAVELLWAAFIGGLKAAELGILGPLKEALDFFGIQIDGLNNKVASLLEDLSIVNTRLGQGFKNLGETRGKVNEGPGGGIKITGAPPGNGLDRASELLKKVTELNRRGAGPTTISPRKSEPDKKASDRIAKEAEREAKALADARIEIQKVLAERSFKLEADRLNRELDLLKSSYDQRRISVSEFYKDKLQIETTSVENELNQITALIAAERKKQAEAKKDSERVKIDKEILDLQTKKILLEKELGRVQEDNFEAFLQTLARRAAEEKKRKEDVAQEVLENQIRRDAQRADLIRERMDTARTGVDVDQELGLITELEARKQILAIERAFRAELELELERKLKLALLTEDPRAVEQIRKELEELRLLGVELDNVARLKKGLFDDTDTGQLFEDLGRDLRSTVKGAFSDLIKEPENFFRNLVSGFRDALAQMASELLTSTFLKLLRQIFNTSPAGGSGSGGGFLSGVFGFLSSFVGGLLGGIKLGGGGATSGISSGGGGGFGTGGSTRFGRAFGGPVTAGTSYPVGERGMEWFVPQTNGRIVPNQAGMMAPQVSVTVVVQGVTNPREFIASSDQIATKLAEQVERSLRLR